MKDWRLEKLEKLEKAAEEYILYRGTTDLSDEFKAALAMSEPEPDCTDCGEHCFMDCPEMEGEKLIYQKTVGVETSRSEITNMINILDQQDKELGAVYESLKSLIDKDEGTSTGQLEDLYYGKLK